jgi:hypothetical protein
MVNLFEVVGLKQHLNEGCCCFKLKIHMIDRTLTEQAISIKL